MGRCGGCAKEVSAVVPRDEGRELGSAAGTPGVDERLQPGTAGQGGDGHKASCLRLLLLLPLGRRVHVPRDAFCRCTREAVQEESGIKISKDTWAASRRHAYWPGAFEPIPKLSMPRQGIKTERLTQLLKWLQNPGLLQQYAFGSRGRVEGAYTSLEMPSASLVSRGREGAGSLVEGGEEDINKACSSCRRQAR